MSTKIWLAGMLAASALVIGTFSRSRASQQQPAPTPVMAPEAPWLSAEATSQIAGGPGTGIFEGVELGEPVAPELRQKVAAFARKNHVAIDLQMADGVLAAVRFEVEYGGCCGYEPADLLGRRMGRPTEGGGCLGGEKTYINDWASSNEGVRMRGRVDINKVTLRWEAELALPEVFARAEGLIGRDVESVAKQAGERWLPQERGHFLLEVPYSFRRPEWQATRREELGFDVTVVAGRITEVSMDVAIRYDDMENTELLAALQKHWRKGRKHADGRTWYTPGRTIDVDLSGRVAIRAR